MCWQCLCVVCECCKDAFLEVDIYAVFSLICAPYYNFPAFMINLGTAKLIFVFKSCS